MAWVLLEPGSASSDRGDQVSSTCLEVPQHFQEEDDAEVPEPVSCRHGRDAFLWGEC